MKKIILSLLILFTTVSFSQNKTFTLEYNKVERFIENKLVESAKSENIFLFNIGGATDMAILYSDGFYEKYKTVGKPSRVEGTKAYQKILYKSYISGDIIELRVFDKKENGLILVITGEKNEFKFTKS